MGPEKSFENQVKHWLESRGIYHVGTPKDQMDVEPCGYYVKRWGGGRYVPDGLPDLQVSVHGISLDIELKAENGKPSPLQIQKIKQMQEAGCIAFILRPSGFIKFKGMLERIIRRHGCNPKTNEMPKEWLL